MPRGAVWDLGSSSFQVVVCKSCPSEPLQVLLRRRSLLNLGLHVGASGLIPSDKVTAALSATKRLAKALEGCRVDVVVALATAALRDAANGPAIVRRIEKVIGAPVLVLSGEQEAQLCFLGQRAGVYIDSVPTLGIDLGGGSIEIAVGDRDSVAWATSAPLGATRLLGELGAGEILTSRERRLIETRAKESLEGSEPVLARYPGIAARTVASGGTARALARLATAKIRGGSDSSKASVNQVELPAAQVHELAEMLAGMDLAERLALPGMPPRRAAMLPVGASILAAVARVIGIERYVVSEWGLREGALIDAFAKLGEARYMERHAGA